jgi:hypothetical protein
MDPYARYQLLALHALPREHLLLAAARAPPLLPADALALGARRGINAADARLEAVEEARGGRGSRFSACERSCWQRTMMPDGRRGGTCATRARAFSGETGNIGASPPARAARARHVAVFRRRASC